MPETERLKAKIGSTDFSALFSTFEVGPLAEFNARNFETAIAANAAMMKGVAAYWDRLSKFVSRRVQSDAEAAQAICDCRTGEDAIRAQHEFVSKMISDYSLEMHELLTISADMSKGVAGPVQERARESVRNIEAHAAAE